MGPKNLKLQTIRGIIWKAVDSFAVQGIQLIIGIVLARILMPSDYGLLGMLAIFLALSQTFVDSGMGSGLIQRKDCSSQDFSTVFVFNFGVSAFFYLLLYVSAPYIANFYNVPELIPITRVIGINIIINALSVVQRARLTIALDFKTQANINIIATSVSGVVAIYLAYSGFGVWSLVVRQIVSSVISVVLLWSMSSWKPSVVFSKQSFKELFGYGSKLLVAGLVAQTFNNIYNIVIGKAYSAKELGFYTQAKGYAEITAGTVSSIIHQVTFPVLSSLKDDTTKMISVYRRMIKMSSFFIFPAMTLLSVLADPFIRLFLGEKWLLTIPLLQLMAFARIFFPLSVLNMNILNAIGRSDLFLKVDLSKLPMTILALIITLPLGVKAMVIGHVVTSSIAYFINAYLPGKYFGYGAIAQLKDMWPYMLGSVLMAFTTLLAINFIESNLLQLIIGAVTAVVTYLLFCYWMKVDEINEIKDIVGKLFRKK